MTSPPIFILAGTESPSGICGIGRHTMMAIVGSDAEVIEVEIAVVGALRSQRHPISSTPVDSDTTSKMSNGTSNNTVAASAMHLFAPDPNAAGSESVSRLCESMSEGRVVGH